MSEPSPVDAVFEVEQRLEAVNDKIKKLSPPKFDDGLLDQLEPTVASNADAYRGMVIRTLILVEPVVSFVEQIPESDFEDYAKYLAEKRALKEKKVKENA